MAKTFINNVFSHKNKKHNTFSKIIMSNPELLNERTAISQIHFSNFMHQLLITLLI